MKIKLSKLKVKSFVTEVPYEKQDTAKGGGEPVQTQAIVCNITLNTCAIICNPPRTQDKLCFTQNVLYCGQ